MPRIDLVLALIRSATQSDQLGIREAVEAIASEENQRGHDRAAERLRGAATGIPSFRTSSSDLVLEDGAEGLFTTLAATRGLADLELEDRARSSLAGLIREQKLASRLHAAGLTPRHKVLLSGPPGNGKTSVAEALAHDLGVPFFVVSYGSLIGSLLGETNKRIESLFAQASQNSCVLFFDEFEAIGKERADRQETGEMKRALASLLTQIDVLPSKVVVVAATNHPEMLDRAVWRRFEIKLVLPPPGYSRIIRYLIEQLQLQPSLSLIQVLGQCFSKASFAELKDFTLDVRRSSVLDGIDVKSALRQELEIRFPEIDWPLDDDRPDQTIAALGPAPASRPVIRKSKKNSGK
jgi:hypothetical protein